jgi:hypothetical protein
MVTVWPRRSLTQAFDLDPVQAIRFRLMACDPRLWFAHDISSRFLELKSGKRRSKIVRTALPQPRPGALARH